MPGKLFFVWMESGTCIVGCKWNHGLVMCIIVYVQPHNSSEKIINATCNKISKELYSPNFSPSLGKVVFLFYPENIPLHKMKPIKNGFINLLWNSFTGLLCALISFPFRLFGWIDVLFPSQALFSHCAKFVNLLCRV